MSAAAGTRHRRAESADIAIVGYGPTGMALAALAGAMGHRVVVLERYTSLYNLPRAACFDDEIMRTFQKLGVTDEVLPGVVVQPSYEWVNGAGETLLELSYDDPAPGGWAALYMMYQPHVEGVLDRHCRSLPNVKVLQGVAVCGIEAGADGVSVSGEGRDGELIRVRARFVVGADGGAGFVRPALGIGLSDYSFEENWLVCDFRKRGRLDDVPTFRQVCDPAQPIAIVQIGPEHHRFSFMLDRHESTESATDERRVWERVARYLGPADAELVRVANYVFRSRVAERWRDGPIMLAGDAAHEMPPFLAQGMCSGIRDAHNLAWKLDLLLRGHASEDLLDTYQAEREPHVRFITERAIELGRVQTLRDPDEARLRDARMLAARRARVEPDKIRLPPLCSGLIAQSDGATHAGEMIPQGQVKSSGRAGRFDDLVGPGPCILARRADALAKLDPASREWWHRLGGRIVTLAAGAGEDGGELVVADSGGTYQTWFEERGAAAAIVRPDWYLYGTAASAGELADLLGGFARAVARVAPTSARRQPAPARPADVER